MQCLRKASLLGVLSHQIIWLETIGLERQARLERQKVQKEKFRKPIEMANKEEMFRKRILLAEIRENNWKRRGSRSSHEEHSERLEKVEKEKKKKEKREKVRDRLKMLEEMKKPAEEKENEKRKAFMENWKEKEKRKKKQEIV